MTHHTRAIAPLIPFLFPPLLGAQDVPLAWDFAEVWRAGGLQAPEWAEFTRRGEVAFDGSGNLYVVDVEALHIVKVGPDGSLVGTIGRAGEGPGEFGLIRDAIVWPDGSFFVRDHARDGLQLFGADGFSEWCDGVRWRAGWSFPRVRRGRFVPARARGSSTPRGRTPASALCSARGPRQTSAWSRRSTSPAMWWPVKSSSKRGVHRARERANAEIEPGNVASPRYLIDVPCFEPELEWDMLPGGAIAYADSSTYTVRIVRDGVVLNTLTRPIAPQPVTRAMESRMRDGMLREVERESGVYGSGRSPDEARELAARGRQVLAAAREAIENGTFYPEIPVIGQIRTTPDGFVWVRRQEPLPDGPRREGRAWTAGNDGLIDVFDPKGNYVGTFPGGGLRMPHAFGPDGLVAYWETDELDILSIVVYRLPENLRR